MKTEKNTMDYMALIHGNDWHAGINEDFVSNEPFEAIDREFGDDMDWLDAINADCYWGGQIELDGKSFWIAGEHEVTMTKGICFLVEN